MKAEEGTEAGKGFWTDSLDILEFVQCAEGAVFRAVNDDTLRVGRSDTRQPHQVFPRGCVDGDASGTWWWFFLCGRDPMDRGSGIAGKGGADQEGAVCGPVRRDRRGGGSACFPEGFHTQPQQERSREEEENLRLGSRESDGALQPRKKGHVCL